MAIYSPPSGGLFFRTVPVHLSLGNVAVQPYLTAALINLKRLAALLRAAVERVIGRTQWCSPSSELASAMPVGTECSAIARRESKEAVYSTAPLSRVSPGSRSNQAARGSSAN